MRRALGALTLGLLGCPSPPLPPPPPPQPVALAPPDCHADSLEGLLRCLALPGLQQDLRAIARPRPTGSVAHGEVRERCRQRLKALGYEVRMQTYEGGVNVVGRRRGFASPDEVVTLGAHYDHLPDCPGADDNATGVAALLEVARVAAKASLNRTVELACWDEGERGQAGSAAYAAQLKSDGVKLHGAIALESIGYADDANDSQIIPERFDSLFPDQALEMLDNEFRGNFLTVVTDTKTEAWALEVKDDGRNTIELPTYVLVVTDTVKVKAKDDLYRSDHMSFWDLDLPAMLLTDTGSFRNPAHHCQEGKVDAPEALDIPFFAKSTAVALAALVRGAGLHRELGPIR